MNTQVNRGISKTLGMIVGKMQPHDQITPDEKLLDRVHPDFPHADLRTLSYALRGLRDKGLLHDTGVAGVYAKPNGKGKPQTPAAPTDVEMVAIDNLLDAIAKAEPVLKRCKKLLAALDAIK